MDLDTAISRLSFAEARGSGSEALVNIAQYRQEMLDAVAAGKTGATTDDMAERTRAATHHRRVDKTA